jgi:hypothetical protein
LALGGAHAPKRLLGGYDKSATILGMNYLLPFFLALIYLNFPVSINYFNTDFNFRIGWEALSLLNLGKIGASFSIFTSRVRCLPEN